MKRLTAVLIGTAAVVVALGPAVAWGQYATPLRYDLRYTSPSYIPSGTLRRGPPRQPDPYRFGNPLHGNLGVTGNLRLGKSFQGSTPYAATGSQLTETLPSTALSNFRRDSFGVEDIGTGLEYGRTQAYYPDSASVTTSWTAGRRFDPSRFRDRVRYLPPNFNAAPAEPIRRPGNVFTGPGGWRDLGLEDLPAAPAGGYGLGEPQTTEELLESLRALASGMPQEEGQGQAEAGGKAEPLNSLYEVFEKRFQPAPMNLFDAEPGPEARGGESPYERTLKLQYGPEASDLEPEGRPWLQEEVADDEEPARPSRDEAAADRWTTGEARSEPGPPEAADPWARFGAGDAVEAGEGRARRRPLPVPTRPTSGYGRYVLRGHEALRQGQYGRAESLYAAASTLERDRPAAFFGRVHALLASRMYLQAAAVLERGLARHPEWVASVPDLEAVYPKKDVFTRIRRDLKREVDRESTQPGYRFLLAYVEFAVGNADEARAHLTRTAEPSEAQKAMLKALGTG